MASRHAAPLRGRFRPPSFLARPLKVRANYATAIQHDDATTQEDLLEAMDMMMELRKTSRRLLGENHPTTDLIKKNGIQLYLRCKAEFEGAGAEESKEVGET